MNQVFWRVTTRQKRVHPSFSIGKCRVPSRHATFRIESWLKNQLNPMTKECEKMQESHYFSIETSCNNQFVRKLKQHSDLEGDQSLIFPLSISEVVSSVILPNYWIQTESVQFEKFLSKVCSLEPKAYLRIVSLNSTNRYQVVLIEIYYHN